jgi:hypothetical protein
VSLDDLRSPGPRTMSTLDRVSTYLTDGVFLFRVVGVVASGADEIVALEDCYWLDVVDVPLSDLPARGLRVVTPALAPAGA